MKQTRDTTLTQTALRRKREKRNRAMVDEYRKLAVDAEKSRTAIIAHLKNKYGFYTMGSVYAILKKYRDEETGE